MIISLWIWNHSISFLCWSPRSMAHCPTLSDVVDWFWSWWLGWFAKFRWGRRFCLIWQCLQQTFPVDQFSLTMYQISFSRLRSFVWFLVWKVSWPPPAATKSSALLASGTSTMPWNNWAWRVTVRQGRKSHVGGNVELAYLVFSKMPVWILTLAQVDQYIESCLYWQFKTWYLI